MKISIVFSLVFMLSLAGFPAIAGNGPREIVLVSEEWANATNRDGTGLYWDIFRAVYEPAGVRTRFIIRPYSRSVRLVKHNRADALVGAYPAIIKGALFARYPFDKDLIFALFKKSQRAQWKGQISLRNKKVAWINGFAFDEYLHVPVLKKEFSSRKTILQLLDKNQLDFFLDSHNDLEAVLNRQIVDVTRYTVEEVMQLDRYLAFSNSKKGEKLRQIFNQRYPLLVKSGEIEKLFAKWNW
jgi:polar amino acid transport system substrate-binding protein